MTQPQSDQPEWSLQGQALDRFLSRCRRTRYGKGAELCRPGDPSGGLQYVVEGSVCIYAVEPDGGEFLLDQVTAGGFLGEIGLFRETGIRKVVIRAKMESDVAEISSDQLLTDMKGILAPDAATILFTVGRQLADRLLTTQRAASDLALLNVKDRIERALVEMSKSTSALPHSEGNLVHISRTELSRRVSCSREVAGRMIKRLAEEGFLDDLGRTLLIYKPLVSKNLVTPS